MALPLLAIAAGKQAGSSILGGFFGASQKKNEAAIAKYNAAVMHKQAEAIRMKTKFLQLRQAKEGARVQDELRAAIGGSGTVATEGAPLLALELQKSETALENYMIGYEGRQAAEQAENQSLEYSMQKQFARIGARQSLIGGFLGAGASAATMYAMQPKKTPIDIPSGTAMYGGYGGGTMSGRPAGSGSASMYLPSYR